MFIRLGTKVSTFGSQHFLAGLKVYIYDKHTTQFSAQGNLKFYQFLQKNLLAGRNFKSIYAPEI